MNVSRITSYILNALFPQSTDEALLARLTPLYLIDRMEPRREDGVVSLFEYREPDIRALLWQTKYRHDARAVTLLGASLAAYLRSSVQSDFALIPIPLSGRRERERGYNQVEWIAREAVKVLSRGSVMEILYRTRHTVPQTKLSRAERLTNLKDAFAARGTGQLEGKTVIILDDVITTGATLREAKKALERAGIKEVRCVAMAH